MDIQEAIFNLQSQNPHLRIDRLHTDGDMTGYVRVSLLNTKSAAESGQTMKPGFHEIYAEAEQRGYSKEDAEGIARVAEHMEAHLSDNTRSDELARIAHMSPAKLKYTFSDLMHCTIREYRRVIRLKKASLLLIETNQTMEEIASELGYKKTSNFISFFKQYMQIHPPGIQRICTKIRTHYDVRRQ